MSEKSKENWRQTVLPADATVQQAIRNLDQSAMQIVLVLSPDGRLVGTVTDGDVRRGLLSGLSLDNPIHTVMQSEPLVVPSQLDPNAVLQLMQANKIHQLPAVDEKGHVLALHVWDELIVPRLRENLMVIMAGGKGIRLRPQTENCPKPMLPVGDKPMLEHIIERAVAEGFRKFVLTTQYLGHMIEDHFGDGSHWNVEIGYVREESPLGSAGAISLLKARPAAPFLVSNGDVLSDIRYGDLLDFHCRHGAAATMAVRQHEWQHPFGVVDTDGVDIVGIEEKPISRTHINAGVYVLEPHTLDALSPGDPCDMPTLFGRLQVNGNRTIVYPMHEPWLDVGNYEAYASAQQMMKLPSS